MKESILNKACADKLIKEFPSGRYIKHADRFTKAIPDSTFSYNGPTSWLEFKLLGPTENIHAQLKKDQLVELIKLERATNGRAWVIAYRKANPAKLVKPKTLIYKPTALLSVTGPVTPPSSLGMMGVSREHFLEVLRTHGVVEFEGFDHGAIVSLIRQTHDVY